MNKNINCILGAGQVANTLKNNIHEPVKLFNKGEWENKNIECDFLHIAIPYTKEFINIIENAKKVFNADIIIIHSTVEPGTSKIFNCLYSPVLGRHDDDFSNNVKLYRKFIAGNVNDYKKIFDQFNLKCEYWGNNTTELEYAKIMSTTKMYWDLMFNKILDKDCQKNNFNYQNVYYRWTDNYNAGIRNNHPAWERSIYEKMETEKPGGHCLKPNIHLVNNDITKIIKAWEKGIKYIVN